MRAVNDAITACRHLGSKQLRALEPPGAMGPTTGVIESSNNLCFSKWHWKKFVVLPSIFLGEDKKLKRGDGDIKLRRANFANAFGFATGFWGHF